MLNNKFYDKSFKYSESMKSRVFLDHMAEVLVRLEKGLKSELREERDKLVGKLSAITRQMQETGGNKEKKLQQLKEEYRRVESQFDDLLIKIQLENYPQPLSVRDLQTDILKKGETLLSYFISPEKAYSFIVSRENFKVTLLPINEKEINSYVERFLHSIKENNTNDMNRFGSLLYEKLIKPLEKHLKKNRGIIIVPAGKLETIPFGSLIIEKEKSGQPIFLLEKYRLKYVQSASLLSILRKYYTRESTSNCFIGFGDPVYDYEYFKQGKPEQSNMKIFSTESTEVTENSPLTYSPHSPNSPGDEIKEIHRDRYARAGGIMDRLPHSGEEIKTIARIFEKESLKSVAYLREQSTEENAKAPNMKDFDYIHLSCHGLLNDDFQSLVLSQLPLEKSKEDGYFTLNEIMNRDYNAKLVVLSACQTGSGKMYKGEGVTGLTRAVMYAGTPAVIASLWKVDDIATKELMIRFYKNMLEKNLDKVEALRQAKLELLKSPKYSSPLFWSAFVLYGE
jgi:CHAT domain-containing protein